MTATTSPDRALSNKGEFTRFARTMRTSGDALPRVTVAIA